MVGFSGHENEPDDVSNTPNASERPSHSWIVMRMSAAPSEGAVEQLPGCSGQILIRTFEPELHVAGLEEPDYRLFRRCGVSGGLVENVYAANLKLRIAIRLRSAVESRFLDFLGDNAFMSFAEFAERHTDGDDVLYAGDTLLHSAAFRNASHEIVTFAWRSPPEVAAQVRAEVFDDDGAIRFHGGLSGGAVAASRAFVYRDPHTGSVFEEAF